MRMSPLSAKGMATSQVAATVAKKSACRGPPTVKWRAVASDRGTTAHGGQGAARPMPSADPRAARDDTTGGATDGAPPWTTPTPDLAARDAARRALARAATERDTER